MMDNLFIIYLVISMEEIIVFYSLKAFLCECVCFFIKRKSFLVLEGGGAVDPYACIGHRVTQLGEIGEHATNGAIIDLLLPLERREKK